ncbi:MAG: sigma 54-interacting transcriptional regulator [Proteobacteria bacterium]|nr:sigma 54-interacting transcriptional regulator [Pseudomonadota bacterium]
MDSAQALQWSAVFKLHVVKRIAKVLNRRWRLGFGYVDVISNLMLPPRTDELAGHRGLCQVIQDVPNGQRACRDTARGTADEILSRVRAGILSGRSWLISCHADLHEIVAPIIIDGECFGAFLCGGFFAANAGLEEADRRRLDAFSAVERRVRALGLSPSEFQSARNAHPWLLPNEVELARELVEAAAEEVAIFHGEFLRKKQSREGVAGGLRQSYGAILGRSKPMQELYSILDRVIPSDSTVLIQGENGTGKELVARAIHYGSGRRNRRFVVTNCSAFNDNLLDSELFGHRKGAFTGAIADKQGLFEAADRGTFFLDEIGDMSPSLQVKVLRVLQEGTFTPVGHTEMRKVDVRIIAATNRDLKAMVGNGQFREDLYYRINVINLVLAPLRERREDIELLIDYFLQKHTKGGPAGKTLSSQCRDRLLQYDWPGNVRELENEIERLLVLAGDEPAIDETMLSQRIRQHSPNSDLELTPLSRSLPEAIRRLERRMIFEALERHDWNKTRASAELEISRRNLIRLVQKYNLEAERNS